MLYVIHTTSGKEDELIDKIHRESTRQGDYADVFCVRRRVWKKFKGKWQEVSERLFPGYVFIETDKPKAVQEMLFMMEGYGRLLGQKGEHTTNFIPLKEHEEALMYAYMGKESHSVDISKIKVLEGKKVQIVDGPLLGQEGRIKKIDLHKRIAQVEVTLFNQTHTVHLGIEIVREIN